MADWGETASSSFINAFNKSKENKAEKEKNAQLLIAKLQELTQKANELQYGKEKDKANMLIELQKMQLSSESDKAKLGQSQAELSFKQSQQQQELPSKQLMDLGRATGQFTSVPENVKSQIGSNYAQMGMLPKFQETPLSTGQNIANMVSKIPFMSGLKPQKTWSLESIKPIDLKNMSDDELQEFLQYMGQSNSK
jgi:hypothetical protein